MCLVQGSWALRIPGALMTREGSPGIMHEAPGLAVLRSLQLQMEMVVQWLETGMCVARAIELGVCLKGRGVRHLFRGTSEGRGSLWDSGGLQGKAGPSSVLSGLVRPHCKLPYQHPVV